MKKAIVASILGIAGSVATTYGQGIIQFNNYATTSFQPVYFVGGGNADSANVEVALLYALGTFANTSSFLASATQVSTAFIDPTLNTAGTYHGSPTIGTGGPGGYYTQGAAAVLAGWAVGDTATFMVEGWDSTGGLTFANALAKGQSGLWTETVDPGLASSSLTGFGIVPTSIGAPAGLMANGPLSVGLVVPEPTTLALAGLGGLASLVALRRKKA